MIKQSNTIFPQPFYYIGFSVTGENEIESQFQTLFSDEKKSFKYFLEHEMHGFRYAGWGLPKDRPYTIQLDGLEYKDAAKRTKIRENGQIIIQAAVSEEFLCWANSSKQSAVKGDRIQINTTALIEFTYNSVILLKRALEDIENPKQVTCEFGFVGMDKSYVLGNEKLQGESNVSSISFEMNPIGNDTESSIQVNPTDISNEEGAAKTTYLILEKVYRMFSFAENVISYVHQNGKMIDIELIKKNRN